MLLRLKRAYERPDREDGCRILVDRLWPRGVSKSDLRLDAWLKGLAPSTELRRSFRHAPARWEEFKGRYHAELRTRPEAQLALQELSHRLRQGPVTLIYAARDMERNNAVALKAYLEKDAS